MLKLTNIDIHPATSLYVLKNVFDRYRAGPCFESLAVCKNERKCAYILGSTGRCLIDSGTPIHPLCCSSPKIGAPAYPSSGGSTTLNRSLSQKNSFTSSYITRSTIGDDARPCTSLCKKAYRGRTTLFK